MIQRRKLRESAKFRKELTKFSGRLLPLLVRFANFHIFFFPFKIK